MLSHSSFTDGRHDISHNTSFNVVLICNIIMLIAWSLIAISTDDVTNDSLYIT